MIMDTTLVMNSPNLLETWLRGVETTKHEDCASCGRKCSINVFGSKATSVEEAVMTLYLF